MLKSTPKAEEIKDMGDLTISPDLSPDHCQYQHCKNRSPSREAYKFKPGEEKYQIEACLAASGPARSSSSALMLPPPAPVISDVSSQLQMVLLQVLQGLGSSRGVALIPDVSVINRSVKNAKVKGAAPDTRLPVAILSGIRKMSLKTGYSKAHDRYELDKEKYRFFAVEGQGVMAKVFVQVKMKNGTKKGESFYLEGLLLMGDDFFLVDSSWTPILNKDNMDSPTDIFFKGIKRGAGKKGTQIGSLKFVLAPTPDMWYLVMKPGAAEKYQLWQAGDEVTPLTFFKCKTGDILQKLICVQPEFQEDKILDFSFTLGPPFSVSSLKSTVASAKSGLSKCLCSPILESGQMQKQFWPEITPSACQKFFNVMADVIKDGRNYKDTTFLPGLPIHEVQICLVRGLGTEILQQPQFQFTTELISRVHIEWAEKSNMAYVQAKATSLGETPGLIPDLCFVNTAIVLKLKPDSVKTTNWKGGFTALVERLLPSEELVKYANASSWITKLWLCQTLKAVNLLAKEM
ncbi:hypothetical protein ARMGADRAFT_1037249 [Armillaria gallica]|uniref:Uncharacterized protein n=1 Tax=Armillaria gallica TaxID=47427 RepID=A0A2H3D7M5_ARMGA|nr:hypothetical protein ARMGADRAFT_1037249 [Armillaria gallica]